MEMLGCLRWARASQRKQMITATLEQGHGDKDEGMLLKNRQVLREE